MHLVSPRHLARTSGFNPSQHSPTSPTRSPLPFAESQTPPCPPKSTGQIWNEHERRALDKAKSCETSYAGSHLRTLDSQRSSSGTVLNIIKSYRGDPYTPVSSPVPTPSPSPYLDFSFPDSLSKNHTTLASTTNNDACSACTQPPNLLSAGCPSSNELPTENKEISEPHLGHAQQNPTSTHLPSLPQQRARYKAPALPRTSSQPSTPYGQMSDLQQQQQHQQEQQACHTEQGIHVYPMRSTSLGCPEPPPPPYSGLQDYSHHHHQGKEGNRSQQPRRTRNPSLTDPNAPRMRCFERKPLPPPPPSQQQQQQQQQQCSTPLSPSPPATAAFRSGGSATPTARRVHTGTSSPPSATSLPDFPSPPSVSPSSRGIASPVRCASYALQQTVSVWEDDDDDEKANLVDYFKRGLRGSKSSFLGGGGGRRESEQVLLRKGKGQGQGKGWVGGFVRVVSSKKGLGGEGDGVSSSSTTVAVDAAEPANGQLDYDDVSLRLLSKMGRAATNER
ncbi:uncharacterized protein K441DRAFT_681184 [Cenococcum geophilum 1.58]|uniref:uncharacterized protein n=1 Tax=Cenococcum geophilum 1.58 TaxID=794803 RepID=UPI00358DF72B|nr:hypothetical protein K441DRAFT_681184 [Cenococcum geophilum 1.58]